MQHPGGRPEVVPDAKATPYCRIGPGIGRVTDIALGDSGSSRMVAAVIEGESGQEVHIATLARKRSLLGKRGDVQIGSTFDLTGKIRGQPQGILVPQTADAVLVSTGDGEILYFFQQGNEMSVRQVFKPFEDQSDQSIASMDFVLGDVSIVVTNNSGVNRVFSLFVPQGGRERIWGKTKEFRQLPGQAKFFSASLRNKAFLLGGDSFVSLRRPR
jgi:hypothetical protein